MMNGKKIPAKFRGISRKAADFAEERPFRGRTVLARCGREVSKRAARPWKLPIGADCFRRRDGMAWSMNDEED